MTMLGSDFLFGFGLRRRVVMESDDLVPGLITMTSFLIALLALALALAVATHSFGL